MQHTRPRLLLVLAVLLHLVLHGVERAGVRELLLQRVHRVRRPLADLQQPLLDGLGHLLPSPSNIHTSTTTPTARSTWGDQTSPWGDQTPYWGDQTPPPSTPTPLPKTSPPFPQTTFLPLCSLQHHLGWQKGRPRQTSVDCEFRISDRQKEKFAKRRL